MDKTTAQTDAARKLIDALDRYRSRFDAMVQAQMDLAIYEEVSACLAEIRDAKGVIFSQVASESVDFVMAHTNLMASLWNARLAKARDEAGTFFDGQSGSLHAEHDETIQQLRRACQKVLADRRMPPSPRPSPPPPGSGV
jgi:hypothetical protein